MPATSKGVRGEREIIKLLWENGYAAIRSPASGAAVKTPRPDIIAGSAKMRKIIAMELKVTEKETLYLPKEKLQDLSRFSRTFGCEAYLGVKFTGGRHPWMFISLKTLLGVRKNSLKITYPYAQANGHDLKSILGVSVQKKLT